MDLPPTTWARPGGEEIDLIEAGGNYGWPRVEGPSGDARFRPPIYHYPAASISGRARSCPDGGGFPPLYRGLYFFADFVKGWVKALDPDHPGRTSRPSPPA